MRQRHLFIIIIALILAILAYFSSITALQSPVALAHAYVIGSDPVDGSTISTVPDRVRIFFNATLSPLSTARVYAIQDGHLTDVSASSGSIPTANPQQLNVPLQTPASLPKGSYEIKWTAISNDDGHTTYGIIGFNVGYASTGLSGTPKLGPSTSNNLAAIRAPSFIGFMGIAWEWIILITLTLWVGILLTERLPLAATRRSSELLERARKPGQALQQLCLTILLLAECVTFVLRTSLLTQNLNETGFDLTLLSRLLTDTNYGQLWAARMILIVAALCLLSWASHPQSTPPAPEPALQRVASRTAPLSRAGIGPQSRTGSLVRTSTGPLSHSNIGTLRHQTTQDLYSTKERLELLQHSHIDPPVIPQSYTVIWLLLAGLIMFTHILSGEAAQVLHPHISAVFFDWFNLLGLSMWFGGFAYLGYVLLPLLPIVEQDHEAEALAALLQRLTPFILIGMGIFLASNLFLSEASVPDIYQLLNDPYGQTLLIQWGTIAIAFLLSLHALFLLRPKLTRQVLLLPVVNADLPARRTRQFAMGYTERSLKRAIGVQIWLGTGILLCVALMAFYTPPIVFPDIPSTNNTSANVSTTPTSLTNIQTKQVGHLSITLQTRPAQVSYTNTVIITIVDSNSQIVSDAQVQLTVNMQTMDMGTAHLSIPPGNPTYVATFDKYTTFSMPGTWLIQVNIQRPKQPPVQTTFEVIVH